MPSFSYFASLIAKMRGAIGATSRGRTLSSGRHDDGQNRGTTSGSLKMSANVPASSGAGAKAAVSAKISYRWVLAASLTVLLSGAAVSARSEDGPMASAPLPPPLPSAPPATVLQHPQGEPSRALQGALPKSSPPAETRMQVGNLPRHHDNAHRKDASARATRGQKRTGQRAVGNIEHRETRTVPQVASVLTPPPAPLPFPYGYFPGAAPAYGYAPAYPPPWPPGPMLLR